MAVAATRNSGFKIYPEGGGASDLICSAALRRIVSLAKLLGQWQKFVQKGGFVGIIRPFFEHLLEFS